ncbi:MAG TPA: helical backbone metal receptor [Gemmatimonadaceae bacterium]|nr:helical backbone metal receptor [Gemmatimonadaceae bacterium]
MSSCLSRASRRSAAAAAAALLALACAGDAPARADVLRDDFGAELRAPAPGETQRIVSLNPATTELLFAIGAGEALVGRSHWDEWPDSARLVPDLGPALRPNVEAVLARRPTLVVLYASGENRGAAEQLRAAGVQTLALTTDEIAQFRRAARILGAVTGREARAAAVVDSVDRTLARVRAATAALRPPTVFVHVWDDPVITVGAGSFMTELVAIAGGRNVYADVAAPSAQVALEDVVRRDPELMLAGPVGAARLRSDPAWRAVPAVRAGRIVVADTTLIARPSVRLGEAAVSLARLFHPGLGL